jgi:hypothetical protein
MLRRIELVLAQIQGTGLEKTRKNVVEVPENRCSENLF